ncbi:MAG: hypothetical protein ACW98X_04635 [Promethearchaeota archaeon]|jgi:translation initiation factor 2 beta subunit (eIF-2beta)/eIF-5
MDEKKEKNTLLFFNEAIEYFDKFSDQNYEINEPIRDSRFNANFLRNSMLTELNHLKDLIENHPDSKIEALSDEDKEKFHKFISYYKNCPICGNPNHYFNLKQLFFNESKKILLRELIRLMNIKNKRFRTYNLNLGVPCCECFKRMSLEK